jgi:Entner-Doudoroff aldolase
MSDLFDTAAERSPLLAILRGFSPTRTVELCHAAWNAGAELVEVPIQDDSAHPSLAAAVRAGHEAGRVVGAGTVTTLDRLAVARELGAAFTVAPGFDPEVATASRDSGMPHLPGVATPTEIQHALAAGFVWLKAFPAAQLGPEWIRAVRAPFPEARFVATGGVTPDNARAFLDAGAHLVAIGHAITTLDDGWRHDAASRHTDAATEDPA